MVVLEITRSQLKMSLDIGLVICFPSSAMHNGIQCLVNSSLWATQKQVQSPVLLEEEMSLMTEKPEQIKPKLPTSHNSIRSEITMCVCVCVCVRVCVHVCVCVCPTCWHQNSTQTHTCSRLWKESILNGVIGLSTWFLPADTRTVFETGRGGWKHTNRGLVCVQRRTERDVEEEEKAWKSSANNNLTEREREKNKTVWMFSTIPHSVKFQSVCVFVCAAGCWIIAHGDGTFRHTQHTLMLATWTTHTHTHTHTHTS